MVKVRTVETAKIFFKIYAPSLVIALRINKELNITRINIRPRRLLKLKGARLGERKRSAGCEKVKIIRCSSKKLAVRARKRWWRKSWW